MQLNNNTNIIITGANGFIGSSFLNYFSTHGYKTIALVRSTPKSKLKNVDYYHYELGSEIPEVLLNSNTIFIHCAYSKPTKSIIDYNLSSLEKLIKQTKKIDAFKNVFISSINAEENSNSYYSKIKLLSEQKFDESNDLILRPSLVIGNGGVFLNSINMVERIKILPYIEDGKQPIYFVDIEDLIEYTIQCLKADESGIHVVSNPSPIFYKEFYRLFLQKKNIQFIPLKIPVWLFKFIILVLSITRKPKITQENLDGLKSLKIKKWNQRIIFTFKNLNEITLK